MARKNDTLFLMPFIASVVCFFMGARMIANGLVAMGVNSRTKMISGFGGHLSILIGIIGLVVTYYSISPFSKLRNLGKMFTKRRKHPKP